MSRKHVPLVAERKKEAETLKAGSGKQRPQSTNVTTNATHSLLLAGQGVASILPAQQQVNAASVMQPASRFSQNEAEAGFSPIQQGRTAAPVIQPASGLLQNNRNPPRPDTIRFNGSWDNFENCPPLDWTDYDTSDGADGADFFLTGFAGNNAFQAFSEL
jgi:hypothetical protein